MLEGVDSILKSFTKIARMDAAAINRAFRPQAEYILQRIIEEVPIRTGTLADSYGIIKIRKTNQIMVGAKYGAGGGNHAHLMEDGFTTRDGKVKPGLHYERKIYDENRQRVLNEMEKNLSKEVEKIWDES